MFRSTRFRIRNWRGFLETTMRVGALLRGLLYFIVWKPCKMFIYVCMYACVYVQYIYVSQSDFRLMSFTAGRCGTPLILNDQFRSLRRNGVRSSDLILNDQFRSLRRNGVRSSNLILNDQFRSLRRNGVRSSDLIPNDQLRRNGVRSSDLIVCVSK